MMHAKRTISLLPALLLLAAAVGGCAPSQGSPGESELSLAPLAEMPPEVQDAPVVVQQAYRFAVANPELLTQIPCYCGCGEMGHGSNYACYIAGAEPEGGLKFDAHALGCSICVDITQDVMRMQSQGEDLDAIRAAVDATYSRYGPSNMP